MQPFFAPGNIIGKDYHISTGTKVLPGSFSKAASAAVSWLRLRRPNVLEADLSAGCPARPLQVALSSDPPPQASLRKRGFFLLSYRFISAFQGSCHFLFAPPLLILKSNPFFISRTLTFLKNNF